MQDRSRFRSRSDQFLSAATRTVSCWPTIDPAAKDQTSKPDADDIVSLMTPARLRRVGREMRMLIDGPDNENEPDPSLLRLIARAHDIQERLCQDFNLTVRDTAREERYHVRLHPHAAATSLACTRYHYGDCQCSTTATAECKVSNAPSVAAAY
jgi:hypothetical protein